MKIFNWKLLLLVLAVLAVWLPGEAFSAERVPAMREPVYRQLSAVRDQADKEDYAKAIETLDRLRSQSNLNSYEQAMMWNLYAFVHYSRQEHARAIDAYRRVLQQRPIPESLENAALYSLAQMLVVTEQYGDALEALTEWFARVEEPDESAVMLLGQVHYQLGNYDEARAAIEGGIREAKARNLRVRENGYLMLRAILYAQRDYRALAEVLESLVQEYPKREYWVQLSAVYGELGDEKRQLATLETAYEQELFEQENDYVMLAQLLMSNGVPYKAARVMQAGLDAGVVAADLVNLRTLADAWVLAKEYDRSIAALEAAAKLEGSGELDLRRAQILLELDRNRDALDAARRAIEKGSLRQPEQAHVIVGLALYRLEQLSAASDAFAHAAKSDDTRHMAEQWLEFIDRERARREALDRALSENRNRSAAHRASSNAAS